MEFNSLSVVEELEKVYLINSIPKFRRCLQDLDDRDDENLIFNIDLTIDEMQILGNLMVVEYLSSQIISIKNIEQSMSNGDFRLTSQAEHLGRLLQLRKDRQSELSKMIVDYTYSFSDLTKLR
jgi:hypothetical protein